MSEGKPTGEFVTLTDDQKKARKRRNLWMVLALVGFAVLIFAITIVRLGTGHGIPERM